MTEELQQILEVLVVKANYGWAVMDKRSASIDDQAMKESKVVSLASPVGMEFVTCSTGLIDVCDGSNSYHVMVGQSIGNKMFFYYSKAGRRHYIERA